MLFLGTRSILSLVSQRQCKFIVNGIETLLYVFRFIIDLNNRMSVVNVWCG